MDAIQTMASEVLVNLALGVIALLGAYGVFYIQKAATKVKAQTAQIKDTESRRLLTDALDDVEKLATLSVGAMEQTTAKALREAVKLGKSDRNELVGLGRKAFQEVKSAIGPEVQQVITKHLGSFDAYLMKQIEDAVRKVKQQDPFITISGESLAGDE